MHPFVARFATAVLVVALSSGARAHAAVTSDVTSTAAPAPRPQGGGPYTAQLVLASLAFIPLTVLAASGDDRDLARGTLAASFVGLPAAVHAVHGRGGLALGSAAIRSVALALPFLYAQSIECHGPIGQACGLDAGLNTAALFLGATIVATITDFALYAHYTGRTPTPEPRARARVDVAPTVAALAGTGFHAGIVGRF